MAHPQRAANVADALNHASRSLFGDHERATMVCLGVAVRRADCGHPPCVWVERRGLLYGRDHGGYVCLVFHLALRRGGSLPITFFLLVLSLGASAVHFLARPHVLSWLFTVIWFELLDSAASGEEPEKRSKTLLAACFDAALGQSARRICRWLCFVGRVSRRWWGPILYLS